MPYICVCVYILYTYKLSFLIRHNITCRHKCNISVCYTGTFGWENKVLNTLLLLLLLLLGTIYYYKTFNRNIFYNIYVPYYNIIVVRVMYCGRKLFRRGQIIHNNHNNNNKICALRTKPYMKQYYIM